jgi:hypothetical protein
MSRHYENSTVEVIEAMHNGLRVETGIVNATGGKLFTADQDLEIFKVYGTIRINLLFGEVTTVFGAGASQGMFMFHSTTPHIAAAAMSIDCASVAAMVAGGRITLQGDLVGTAPTITGAAGVSYWPPSHAKMVVGRDGGEGEILLHNIAVQTIASGAMAFTLCYTPISEGAYAVAMF